MGCGVFPPAGLVLVFGRGFILVRFDPDPYHQVLWGCKVKGGGVVVL